LRTSDQIRYLALAALGIAILGAALWYVLANTPATIAASVIAASATILVAVFGTLASKHLERKQEIEKEHRERKLQVYQQFMDYQFAAMQGRRKKLSEEKKKEFDRAYHDTFPQALISWGSEDIIRKYADWVKWDEPEADVDILELEKILLAMRRDLGYTNKGLRKGDLLRTFLTGVGERLQRKQR
jgi:hypothetical protein